MEVILVACSGQALALTFFCWSVRLCLVRRGRAYIGRKGYFPLMFFAVVAQLFYAVGGISASCSAVAVNISVPTLYAVLGVQLLVGLASVMCILVVRYIEVLVQSFG